jgi:hypothetical protein
MKRAILILTICLTACGSRSSNERQHGPIPKYLKGSYYENSEGYYQQGTDAILSLKSYEEKVLSNIRYCESCSTSGDLLIMRFDDGSVLKVYAYKYDMKFYYE